MSFKSSNTVFCPEYGALRIIFIMNFWYKMQQRSGDVWDSIQAISSK